MEITKEFLETRLKDYASQVKVIGEQLMQQTILLHKYEGACDSIQTLIKEIEVKTEINENKV